MTALPLLLAAWLTPTTAEEPAPWPPAPTVGRVGDRAIDGESFSRWLLASYGPSYLDEYLRLIQVEEAARALDVELPAERVEEAFEREWSIHVARRHKGDEAAFLDELSRGGHTRETFAFTRRRALRGDLLLEQIAVASRDVGAEARRETFDAVMVGGHRTDVNVLYVHRRALLGRPAETPRGGAADLVRRDRRGRQGVHRIASRADRGRGVVRVGRRGGRRRRRGALLAVRARPLPGRGRRRGRRPVGAWSAERRGPRDDRVLPGPARRAPAGHGRRGRRRAGLAHPLGAGHAARARRGAPSLRRAGADRTDPLKTGPYSNFALFLSAHSSHLRIPFSRAALLPERSKR